MSLEENKAIVRRVIGAVNTQNLASLDELVASDFVYHMASQQIRGLDVMKQGVEEEIKGFPDLRVTIEDIVAEGDTVWVHETETGTHKGEYHEIAPTGKKMTFFCVDIFRIVDGKVAEGWYVYDQLYFLKQLGVIEYTEKAKGLFPEDVS